MGCCGSKRGAQTVAEKASQHVAEGDDPADAGAQLNSPRTSQMSSSNAARDSIPMDAHEAAEDEEASAPVQAVPTEPVVTAAVTAPGTASPSPRPPSMTHGLTPLASASSTNAHDGETTSTAGSSSLPPSPSDVVATETATPPPSGGVTGKETGSDVDGAASRRSSGSTASSVHSSVAPSSTHEDAVPAPAAGTSADEDGDADTDDEDSGEVEREPFADDEEDVDVDDELGAETESAHADQSESSDNHHTSPSASAESTPPSTDASAQGTDEPGTSHMLEQVLLIDHDDDSLLSWHPPQAPHRPHLQAPVVEPEWKYAGASSIGALSYATRTTTEVSHRTTLLAPSLSEESSGTRHGDTRPVRLFSPTEGELVSAAHRAARASGAVPAPRQTSSSTASTSNSSSSSSSPSTPSAQAAPLREVWVGSPEVADPSLLSHRTRAAFSPDSTALAVDLDNDVYDNDPHARRNRPHTFLCEPLDARTRQRKPVYLQDMWYVQHSSAKRP